MKITTKTYAAATLTSLALLMLALTASGQTTNIIIANFDTDTEVTGPPWGNWFGGAFQSVAFDSSDASNNASSGSLLITGVFSGAGQQYMVYNQNNGINPAILSPDPTTGYTVTNFQCDIRFDPSSCTNPAGNYGVLNFGSRGTGFDQPMFGTVPVPSGQTNWVHVSLPVNVLATPAWSSIPDVLIQLHTFGAAMSGTSKLYVDNIKFVSGLLPSPPPTMSIVKAGPPGLRVFAGSTGTIYDREGLATADPSQSWIGGTYPVSYSLKILSYPTDVNIAQTHIFLVPVNSSPVGAYGYNGVDYVATNGLWLTINPRPGGGTNGVTATVSWKTNLPNANPFETGVTELRITNSTAVGTWTLTFNNETNGTLTAPGASPAPFIISDSSVATDFANPVVAYFGLQPNGVAGEGEFEDWGSVTVTGVAGVNENQDFTTSDALSADFMNFSALRGSVVLVTTNTPVWVTWNVPDSGFGLGANASLTNANGWFTPAYYTGFGADAPVTTQQGPSRKWTLIPGTGLPTADGSQLGVPSPIGFFRLSNPPPSQ